MLGLPSGRELSRTRVEPKQSVKIFWKHCADGMENSQWIWTSNAGYVIAASRLNLVIVIFLQKIFLICEILAQNLQRAGFEVVKCDKHSSRVCNPCARKIWNLKSLYSLVQESLEGKITEFTAATPPKSTSANKCLLDTPEGKSPIRKSVRLLSPATKTNKGKSSRKSLEFGQERLQASEKENNNTIGQYLNIDNLPEGSLQVKVVFKTESANILVRIPHEETTKCLVRQVCDKNWHAAANSITKHSELFPEVLKAVNKNASNEMSEYLKSESMLLSNKPDEITGFSNTIFLGELRIFCQS